MADLEALKDVLSREPDVLAAYLFGSHARASSGPHSDVDVAVLLEENRDITQRHLDLIGAVSSVVSSESADVVVLNKAPIALAYRVLRDGKLLCSRDEKTRIRHWVDTVVRYLDMEPFRRTLAEGQRHRIEEGKFGRS